MENGLGLNLEQVEERARALGLVVRPQEAARIRVQTPDGIRLVNRLGCLAPTSGSGDYVLRPSEPFGTEVAMQLLAIRDASLASAEELLQEARMEATALRKRAEEAEEQRASLVRDREAQVWQIDNLRTMLSGVRDELAEAKRSPLSGLRHAAAGMLARLATALSR